MNNLAFYYEIIKDYDNMKKYYLMATELNNFKAINNLANYYEKIKDYDNMIIYIKKAYDLNFYEIISTIYNNYNKIKVYYILYKCNISYNMKVDKDIVHLQEQLKLNNITNDECIVCYTPNTLKIQFKNCIHTTCINCYINMNKCYYKC
jgi:tetratricopeptide (TPR) repeat protein